jgi:hypothetical protein
MKTKLLAIALALGCSSAMAGTSLLVFGASHHGSCDSTRWNCDLNNRNPGLGLELADSGVDYSLFVRGGSYRDSRRETAYFMAGGARTRWALGEDIEVGAGAMVGYLNGSGLHGLAGLPFVTVGGKLLQLEIGYVPEIHWKDRMMPATTTFNLRWQID